jgi:hypothetical protein
MQPHTFEPIGPQTWKCACCGRLVRSSGARPPSECEGCLEIERMPTVKMPPLKPSDLEPRP